MTNKKTQKDYFNEIIELAAENGRDDLVAFCEDRIEKLSRKSGSKKPTKTQVENEGLKDVIKDAMATLGKASTVTEIQAVDITLGDLTNQRVSALLRQMVNDGKVVKTIEGKKSLFSLA
jgi:hypothetical protein